MTDLKAHLEAELQDCRAQRDAATRQIQQCQAAVNEAQRVAQIAQANVERCNGGEAQLLALLEKLGSEGLTDSPAPYNSSGEAPSAVARHAGSVTALKKPKE